MAYDHSAVSASNRQGTFQYMHTRHNT